MSDLKHGSDATERVYRDVQRRLKQTYRQALKEIQQQMDAFNSAHKARDREMREKVKAGKMSQDDYAAWQRGQVYQGKLWKQKQDGIAEALYSADVASQRIINDARLNVFAQNANAMSYAFEHESGVSYGFGLYDEATVAKLLRDQPNLLPPRTVKRKEDVEWYHQIVGNCVTQGIIQGESIPEIARRITNTTGERSQSAATRNARTAMTSAENAGRIEGMHNAQAKGIKVKKRWLATYDARTRHAHASLDGQVKEVDEPFDSELGDIMYPGDPAAHPANVYNCRCTLIYEHPEYPSDIKRYDVETGKTVGDMTYRQWEDWKKSGLDWEDWKRKQSGGQEKQEEDRIKFLVGATGDPYTDEQRRAMKELIEKCSGPVRDAWERAVGELYAPVDDVARTKSGSYRAYFQRETESYGRVHLHPEAVAQGDSIHTPYQTHFHEFFHNIDYLMGGPYQFLSGTYVDPKTGKTFDRMLQDESRTAVSKYFDRHQGTIGLGGFTFSEAMREFPSLVMHGFCRNVKSEYSLIERTDISDMFEKYSVTHGGDSYPFGVGHGRKYATDKGNRACEAFAEMGAATMANPDSLRTIKEFFPESYRMFEDMITEAINS